MFEVGLTGECLRVFDGDEYTRRCVAPGAEHCDHFLVAATYKREADLVFKVLGQRLELGEVNAPLDDGYHLEQLALFEEELIEIHSICDNRKLRRQCLADERV
ncbi:conjugative transfer protein, putative [Babesia ovata]|uniref:Conjugative transfer protein, putative n=1 Tax=Babesia ovata TaxID=189622 RepID=A0A2H6K718_9APIC|nr:conjugative transfer protein, putative [Babesia ovata]GBE58781.1 conjugative transfer protein, putative [Babesia ovata]